MRYNQKQSNNFNHELLAANEQHCKYRTARNCICSQMKLLNVNSKKTQALDNIKEYLLETNECPSYSNNVRLDKYNESNSNQLERMWPRRESEFKQTSHTNVQGNNSQIDPHIYSESLQNHGLTSTNLLKSDQATSDERYNSSTTFDSAASGCCSSYSKPYQKKYALIELNDIEMDTSICNQERQRKKSTQNLSCMSYLQDDSQLTQILNHLFSDDDLQ